MNPNELYRKIVEAGDDWADKECAASMLEEARKSLISQIATTDFANESAVKAEMLARASKQFKEYIVNMCKARREANKAKVRYMALHSSIKQEQHLGIMQAAERKAEKEYTT